MTARTQPAFVKLLETDSLTDIALIKSVLDAEHIEYFIQGENLKYLRPVDSAVLMVADHDAEKAKEILKPLNLRYTAFNKEQ